jgi:hypothetical protein
MISLFIEDFEFATYVSKKLIELKREVQFCKITDDILDSAELIIVDLDNRQFGNKLFISQLQNNGYNIKVIGFMKYVRKELYNNFKEAGCSMILPRSSLVTNLSSLVI